MDTKKRVLVTGAGGFIGHHLVRFLKKKGYWVRGVDIKYPEYSPKNEADEFLVLDLRSLDNCLKATQGVDEVYTLAANMGGIGFISFHNSDVLYDNVCINANMAEAAKQNGIKRLFYSSSACIYPTYKQENPDLVALKESDAYPADPDNEYGWEKLFSERLYKSYGEFYEVRIARFHNIFGPEGTYDGGREKAPAALCRKIILAKNNDFIEIWGDGKQTRSFCYIDDCVEGVFRLMHSNFKDPLNIGSDRLVSIDDMISIISNVAVKEELSAKEIIHILSANLDRNIRMNELANIISSGAKKNLQKKYLLDKPQGVRGRNSDNTLCKQILNWEPQISLEEGLKRTYFWIDGQMRDKS